MNNNSIIFIDEIESALHPTALIDYLDMIYELSESRVQFFIATHSYFVIKKLYLLAKEHGISIPVLSLTEGEEPSYQDMVDGMLENSIIDASVKLYEGEVDLSM